MKQPIVVLFGGHFTDEARKVLETAMTPRFYARDANATLAMEVERAHVVVTVGGSDADFGELMEMPMKKRSAWLHFVTADEVLRSVQSIVFCFVHHALRYARDSDLITVFTTSFNSRSRILRPFESLRKQTYTNWEWVIVDDSDGDDNWRSLVALKNNDARIRIYRADGNSGVIGNVKNSASSLARGEYFVELDHDDELTPCALQWVRDAFEQYPDAGLAFSDFTEVHEIDGSNFSYGEHFGFGYGAYSTQWVSGAWRYVCRNPPTNAATMRHLVGCPNHLRAWRRSVFEAVGGWNPTLHVADDYDIIVRTFLKSRFVHIPMCGYVQYRNAGGNNYTLIRNDQIQKLTHTLATYYDAAVRDRCRDEFGVDDPYYRNHVACTTLPKAWHDTRHVSRLNYVSHTTDVRVSIIILVDRHTDLNELRANVAVAIAQDYTRKEVIVVASPDVAASALYDALHTFTVKCLLWWRIAQGELTEARNYACKMLARGDIVLYWPSCDTGDNEERTVKYVSNIMAQFDAQPAVAWSRDGCTAHRTSVFEKVGYWRKDVSLIESYKKHALQQRSQSAITTAITTTTTTTAATAATTATAVTKTD